MRRAFGALAALTAALAGPSGAATEPPVPSLCPATATPAEAIPAPPGWAAWSRNEQVTLPLDSVTFSDGPPHERAFLTPLASRPGRAGTVDRYDFTGDDMGVIWAICGYGGTYVSLIRATDLRGKRCSVTTVHGKAVTAVCR